MRHERATEELKEFAALYALGSLTQHEARSFENHIKEGCSICAAECRRFERAAAVIGIATEEVKAPEYIRDLLSARIDREPIRTPGNPPKIEPSPVVEERTMRELLRPSPAPVLFPPSRSDRPNILPWVLVAVLAILGFGAMYALKSARETTELLQAKVSALTTDAEGLQQKFDNQRENFKRLEQILTVVGKPGSHIARLVVQTTPPQFSAVVAWDTDKGDCLILGNFPPAPVGKAYQLWFFTPLAKVSAGPFKASSTGLVTMPVPRDAVNASAAVITLEPDNGSQIPTSPYYAVGRVD